MQEAGKRKDDSKQLNYTLIIEPGSHENTFFLLDACRHVSSASETFVVQSGSLCEAD